MIVKPVPVEDQFYGDRSGALQDPFGHIWFIAMREEELSLEQIRQRRGKVQAISTFNASQRCHRHWKYG